MVSQDLAIYVSCVSALISGVSLFLSYISYKRASANKLFDLKVLLEKELIDLKACLDKIEDSIERARNSRPRVMAAKGKLRSGEMKAWKEMVKNDLDILNEFRRCMDTIPNYVDKDTPERLSPLLKNLHEIKTKADKLLDKYCEEIKSDNKFVSAREEEILRRQL